MPLLSLPNELLLLIADHLPLSSLSALHRTTHHLHDLTTPNLHRAALLPRPSSYGMVLPALHWAAWNGHTSLARLLLTTFSHPIDAQTDEHGKTALHCAAWQGHLEMVRLLLDSGAAIDAADTKYGKTALHQAVVRGWGDIVALLLERGADVCSRDHDGQTALLWATKCQSPEYEPLVGIFRMLLERDRVCGGGLVDAREDEKGETALHWAVWRRQRATVRLLLEFGADIEVETCDGQTALEWAVRKGDEGILRMVAPEAEAEEKKVGVKEKVVELRLVWMELALGGGEEGKEEEEEREREREREREKGTRWGNRIRDIGKAVGRMALLRQLDKRHIKELGEV